MFENPVLKYIFRYGGPILLLAALIFYFQFSAFDHKGGYLRAPGLVIWIYKMLGTQGTVIVCLSGSAAWFFISIKHYLLKKNGKVVDGKNPNGKPNIWL